VNSPKLRFLQALTDAISRMSAAVAAIAADDYDAAEAELRAVHQVIEDAKQELRAA
jgi:hypothetical protein